MDDALQVLIADPNLYIRSFLARELTAAGYVAKEAGSCKEIFDHLNTENPPDLLVMELDWPASIGLNMLEKVQNLVPPIPQIIFTHLTEYANHPSVQKADDFIEKSEDPGDLLHSISQIIGQQ